MILRAIEARGNIELLSKVNKNVLIEENIKVKNHPQDLSSTMTVLLNPNLSYIQPLMFVV